ncbi:MAG: hypothetical protein ACRCUS_08945 [Anaerovoracaceae bacterium]
MTKEKLSQIIPMQKRIKKLEKMIDKIKDKKTVSDYALDYRNSAKGRAFSITGKPYVQHLELEVQELQEKVSAAEDWILKLKDDDMKTILGLKYMDGKTYEEIGEVFNMASEGIRTKINRFLRQKKEK